MPKPITYCSPKLTRGGGYLMNGDPFICISTLEEMLEEFPEASEYYIEASTKQWSDDSGCEIWVRRSFGGVWTWSPTRQRLCFHLSFAVMDALEDSNLPKAEPVKIYFRLTYYE